MEKVSSRSVRKPGSTRRRLNLSLIHICAGEIPIDIGALVNDPWTYLPPTCQGGINNGGTFPSGNQNFGGVPFAIPTGPNNYWNGGVAANCGSGTVSLTIPVGVTGVTSVFTLLNTMWGQAGPNAYLFITFKGSAGASVTEPLVGGVNVRDFNNDGYQNTINNTSTTQGWTNGEGQRLDRQEYVLPAEFLNQELIDVTITDTGNEVFSRAIFSALTVSTCRAYVTETIGISSSEIIYDADLKLYFQEVTLSNTSSTAVAGPLFFILEDLSLIHIYAAQHRELLERLLDRRRAGKRRLRKCGHKQE